MFQKVIVAVLLMSGVLVAAHLTMMLLSRTSEHDSAPEVQPVAADPGTAQIDYEQLAQEILASNAFISPPPLSQGILGRDLEAGSSAGTGESLPDDPPVNASSKIRLIGTAAGSRPLGRAVVEDLTTKKQSLYHLYDLVPNVGEIVDIREENILIRRGRKEEWLQLQTVKRLPSRGGESGTPSTDLPAPVGQ